MADKEIDKQETVGEEKGTVAKGRQPKLKSEDKTEKKDNWFKRTGKKVKTGMSNHPFWTAFGGAAIGAGTTVAVGYGGKKLLEKRRERNAYIPADSQDPNE